MQGPERSYLTITFIFITLVLLISCTAKTSHEPVPEPEIRIGVIAYHPLPEIDPSTIINAAELAVEEINSGSGITIKGKKHKVIWIRENVNAGVPEESVAAVQRLINQQNVVVVIGPLFSVDAIPAGEIAEISGIPLITPLATNPKVTMNRKFVFRMGFLDEFQGRIAAIFARSELKAHSAAVLYNIADPYSRGLAEVFRNQLLEVDGQIVAFESYVGVEADFSRQLRKIRDIKPEVLYLPNFSEESKRIAVKARDMKIDAILLGGDSWDYGTLAQMPEFDGAYMTAHYSTGMLNRKNIKFVASYREKFDHLPGDTAAMTYDAFHLVIAAMKYKDSADPESIRDGLYEMGPYPGVGDYIYFVENGDPVKGVVILKLKDGAAQFIDIVEGQ